MNFRTRTTTVLAILLAATLVVSAADFHEGLAAYNRGDFETALREWGAMAERGDAESQYRLARMYYHGEGKRDDAAAARWYAEAAGQGHSKAQNNLGLMYQEGRGVERDLEVAARWYREAAEQGLATAQANLAGACDTGNGVERDPATAARWYQKAAEQGHVNSQYRLGVMYDEGTGVSRDEGKAAKWYRTAAKQGHGPAQSAIGSMYAEGRGVSRDVEKATKWLSRASAQGIPVTSPSFATPSGEQRQPPTDAGSPVVARVEEPRRDPPAEPSPPETSAPEQAVVEPGPAELARKHLEGTLEAPPPGKVAPPESSEPTPPREATAEVDFPKLREIGRRAEEGDADAQYRLAQMYATGTSAPQGLEDAARWYLAAANQGHGMAAYKVAFFYLRGRGFPRKDYVQAYRWFSVSADLGVGDAAAWRDKIRAGMSSREIEKYERIMQSAPTEE